MLALLLIIIVTVFSMFVSYSINPGDATLMDYYYGCMVGFLISGIILQISNKWRSLKEMEKSHHSLINLIRNWNF